MSERKTLYQKNQKLEALLQEVNGLLYDAEAAVLENFDEPNYPVIFIVGCPRSGTTLFLQWLAASSCFGYPSNFISRFYQAPFIGAKIQQMLTSNEYAFMEEMNSYNNHNELQFKSELGKTVGPLSPNEFWYFWRRFFPFDNFQLFSEDKIQNLTTRQFCTELAALESVFDKPMALKALIFNWNIPFLAKLLANTLFVYIKRDTFFNIQSLLQARKKFFGNLESWYSFKPREYLQLKYLDPYQQVSGQVYYTNRAIEEGLAYIFEAHQLTVEYEGFCNNPAYFWELIRDKLSALGFNLDKEYLGPSDFTSTNRIIASKEEKVRILDAYYDLSGEDITPDVDN